MEYLAEGILFKRFRLVEMLLDVLKQEHGFVCILQRGGKRGGFGRKVPDCDDNQAVRPMLLQVTRKFLFLRLFDQDSLDQPVGDLFILPVQPDDRMAVTAEGLFDVLPDVVRKILVGEPDEDIAAECPDGKSVDGVGWNQEKGMCLVDDLLRFGIRDPEVKSARSRNDIDHLEERMLVLVNGKNLMFPHQNFYRLI